MASVTSHANGIIVRPRPAATQPVLVEAEMKVEEEEEWATQVATPKPPTDDVQVKIA
jgi:hypothetical protein